MIFFEPNYTSKSSVVTKGVIYQTICMPYANFVIPPYGSMGGYLVYCVFVFFCFFVCMVMDFSAVAKARGVKFCMRVGLLSGQVFFTLVKIGLRGVTGVAALLPDEPHIIPILTERWSA